MKLALILGVLSGNVALNPFPAVLAAGNPPARGDVHAWWPVMKVGASCLALNPADGETKLTACPDTGGVTSPDGTKVAYLSIPPGGGGMELFVANKVLPVSMRVVIGNDGERQVTKGAAGIASYSWMPDNVTIVFASTATGEIYTVRTDAAGLAVPTRISGGTGGCFNPVVSADARIAWCIERSRQGKERLSDVVITSKMAGEKAGTKSDSTPATTAAVQTSKATGEPPAGKVPMPPKPNTKPTGFEAKDGALKTSTLVRKTGVMSLAFRADGGALAYGTVGGVSIIDLATSDTRHVKLTDVSDQLYAHYPASMVWRPDGQLIAATFHFAGGRSAGVDPAKPNEPATMPVIFGDDEVFFVPANAEGDARAWWVKGAAGQARGGEVVGWQRP